MFKNGPIAIDAREMPHFFSCAAEIFLVLVGAQVSTVAITLHQLEYMLLHTGNGCQTCAKRWWRKQWDQTWPMDPNQKELTRAASVKFSRQWLASCNANRANAHVMYIQILYTLIFNTQSILQYTYQHEKHLLWFCLRKIIVEVKYLYLEMWFNPLCPRPPVTAHSFSFPHDPRPPRSSQLADTPLMLAYANRNENLTRLIASFPLLFTTSSDVLCSKFSGVWEMLWIFKVARWTHDGCTKINKCPTGVRASSCKIWTANLVQSLTVGTLTNSQSFIFGDSKWKFCSRLPHRHPKTWHSDADISDLGIF